VVAIVLGGVNAALRRDAVRPTGTVLVAEAADLVAELAEAGGGRRAGESAADHDDVVAALVGRVHQLHVEAVLVPLLLDRPARNLGVGPGDVESRLGPAGGSFWCKCHVAPPWSRPSMAAAGVRSVGASCSRE